MTKTVDVIVTPDEARRILDAYTPEWQRLKKPRALDKLVSDMRDGRWTSGSIIEFSDTPDKGRLLINGQHRLLAVVESGVSVEFAFTYHSDKSEQAAQDRYRDIDKHSPRTMADAIRAGGLRDVDGDLSDYDKKKLSEATRVIMCGFFRRPDTMSREYIFEHVAQYAPAYETMIESVFDSDILQPIRHASVYIAGFVYTIYHQQEVAVNLLKSVASGNVENPHAPARKLREFILYDKMGHGSQGRLRRARYFSCCWNAEYRGTKLMRVSLPAAVTFDGTPLENS